MPPRSPRSMSGMVDYLIVLYCSVQVSDMFDAATDTAEQIFERFR